MSSAPHVRDVKGVIRDLLDRHGRIRAREVLEALGHGISRQAVHAHLRAMIDAGEVQKSGVGKATWYEPAVAFARTYATEDLDESAVWSDVRAAVPLLRDLGEPADGTMAYVFTKMVNNAIDHSGSPTVTVRARLDAPSIVVDVEDAGVGLFAKVASALESATLLEAAQRLMVGKFTTWPERHTGEGIFFSSRSVDVFVAEANGLRWTVDNEREDWAIGEVDPRTGTLVRLALDPARARPLAEVFSRFTDLEDHRFDRTRVVVKMLDAGVRFVSRSEAKRLVAELEPFDHVVLDFAGVTEVGQGFVDELFRVWAGAHPQKELQPANMSDAVRFMVQRGRPRT
ncbi:MAG TPA: DUF4325 domain-containing protein [Egibacteraceae bacterium]|nr:DUF4325 domain-containing protein [Egibacteraceae bacterium]